MLQKSDVLNFVDCVLSISLAHAPLGHLSSETFGIQHDGKDGRLITFLNDNLLVCTDKKMPIFKDQIYIFKNNYLNPNVKQYCYKAGVFPATARPFIG